MTGFRPGIAPPLAALLVTLALTWLTGVATAPDNPLGGLLAVVLLPGPLVVAVAWAVALLLARPFAAVFAAAGVWFAAGWLLLDHMAVLSLAGHVVAGLAAGWALGRNWRLDLALLAVAAALVPLLLWSVSLMEPREQLETLGREMAAAAEHGLPQGADQAQKDEALATQRENIARGIDLTLRIFPYLLALGILGQAVMVLGALWLIMRRRGAAPPAWRLPGFTRWRVPFYVVWALIAGLGLLVTRRAPWSDAGLNLALLAATVLCVQGLAIQFFVTGRMMSLVGRVVYWTVMGVFFAPLPVVSGVVLGVIDQWWDIRRLSAAGDDDDGTDNDDEMDDGASGGDADHDRGGAPADRSSQD